MFLTYVIIAAILLIAELVYFKIADHFNIIDKPNERSSHKRIVLRGGGIIYAISMLVWSLIPFPSPTGEGSTLALMEYWPFIARNQGTLIRSSRTIIWNNNLYDKIL